MADDAGAERSLPASGMKKNRAREQGNIPRSQDLGSAFALAVALIAMLILGRGMFRRMISAGEYYLGNAYELRLDVVPIQSTAMRAALDVALLVLPFMGIMLVAGVVMNLFQVGFLFTTTPLSPRFDRLNPITGLKRFFSLRSLVELLKSLAKLFIVSYIVYLAISPRVEELVLLMGVDPLSALGVVTDMVIAVWWRIALAMIVLGLTDFIYQRWQHDQELKMTPQEAKQEAKELEGDPKVKQRIRQIMRQMAMQRMMAEVPRADVIITNPTHYAVALRYDPGGMSAPVVVAKGMRLQADRIRQIATEHGVPIVQRPEVARLLYSQIEVNEAIPENLFRTVAEILSFVYQIDRRIEKQHERATMLNARQAV